tara:strand:+ start:22045 stop:23085 length:1041 start_codon:yes stop_codon:yes gene_type:complete
MKHVFYVYSNLHALISYEIIRHKKLKLEEIFFICFRKTRLEKKFSDRNFSLSGTSGFKVRLYNVLIKNKKLDFLYKNDVIAYIPYTYARPIGFFKKYVFFEEGIDVIQDHNYRYPLNAVLKDIIYGSIFLILTEVLLFDKPNNIKAYVRGRIVPNYRITPVFKNKIKYFGLIKNPNLNNAKKIQINILKVESKNYSVINNKIPKNSNILVLDPFKGNYFDIKYFDTIIKKLLKYIGNDFLFIKFHPTDYDNESFMKMPVEIIKRNTKKFKIINMSVDILCMNNLNLNIYGITTSLQFYAKIFGNNQSYSLAPFIASIDKKYRTFIMLWGGIDKFRKKLIEYNVKVI